MNTVILGLDALDPRVVERLAGEGRLPNLGRFLEEGRFASLEVTHPPQSEVSWTSIATGVDPGGHGIFDFVHRNPKDYGLSLSLLPMRRRLGAMQFAPPHQARTLFDEAVSAGYPATSLWWPATFPARPGSPVRTIPGLGTPDIQGRLGVGTLFTTDDGLLGEPSKTGKVLLRPLGRGRFEGTLQGPARRKGGRETAVSLPFVLEVKGTREASLQFKDQRIDLQPGAWSPICAFQFRMGLLFRVRAITRFILTHTGPEVRLYALPLQLHPLGSPWPYGTPGGFVRETWRECGPFLTLGWPQDTTALQEGWIDDGQFLTLCDSIFDARRRVFLYHLERHREGVLAAVFDTLDRVQHMFWRDRMDVVEDWYRRADDLVGEVERGAREQGVEQLVILSDHGFSDFRYKVHLNRWLRDNGFLTSSNGAKGTWREIDWPRTQAYAIGLNSLYLNLAGREGQGVVRPEEAEPLLMRLTAALEGWKSPEGDAVVAAVRRREEVFHGPLAGYGPDLVVGFAPGFRASAETGTGGWEAEALEPNGDHWGADHCIEASAVPGCLFAARGLTSGARPSFRDVPALAIGMEVRVGEDLAPPPSGSPPSAAEMEVVEERLRDLGYL